MQTKQVRVLEWLTACLFLVTILCGINSVEAQTIGKTIDQNNYKEYEVLLIPAMLEAVKRGDYMLPTANLDFPYRHWDRFLAAGEKNAGKFDVNEKGDLIDKNTGKIPFYNIYGYPFPKIDPKDPNAGVKIIWNFNFQKYRQMGSQLWIRPIWVGKGGEERILAGYVSSLFLQGRPPGQELKNPQGFLYLELLNTVEPMGMKGMNMLAWDFMDEREITQYAYIPAIRRVRQTSGVSRSDPYMGSDAWLDTTNMWSGKNRTMKWKLVGERTVLVPFTHTRKEVAVEAADGTITMKRPDIKWGFRVKGWKGAPWVPTNMTYVPRSVWIVEQMPLNPYYNWGLHINYVDKETHVIWLKEVYDKAGQFRTWIAIPLHYEEAPSGNNIVGIFDAYQIIDERIGHGYPNEFLRHPVYSNVFMPASRLGPDFFSVSNFLQLSK